MALLCIQVLRSVFITYLIRHFRFKNNINKKNQKKYSKFLLKKFLLENW